MGVHRGRHRLPASGCAVCVQVSRGGGVAAVAVAAICKGRGGGEARRAHLQQLSQRLPFTGSRGPYAFINAMVVARGWMLGCKALLAVKALGERAARRQWQQCAISMYKVPACSAICSHVPSPSSSSSLVSSMKGWAPMNPSSMIAIVLFRADGGKGWGIRQDSEPPCGQRRSHSTARQPHAARTRQGKRWTSELLFANRTSDDHDSALELAFMASRTHVNEQDEEDVQVCLYCD